MILLIKESHLASKLINVKFKGNHFILTFIFRVERSSDQVIKPVNMEALTKWVGNIPEDVVRDMADIAPMLSVLGYDPYANPPNYGKPDAVVADNTRQVLFLMSFLSFITANLNPMLIYICVQ